MKYAIYEVCDALEKTIGELKEAGQKAMVAGDRAAERNLGENVAEDINQILKNIRSKIPYITQPRYAKYFDNGKDVVGV